MPIDELESHPYINHLGVNPDYRKYCSMIIGSFPIYCITNSNPVAQEGVDQRMEWTTKAFMQFFYGSLSNSLWSLLFDTYDMPFPIGDPDSIKQQCINFIEQNEIIITDIITTTNRVDYKADDKNLRPVTFNTDLLLIMMSMKGNIIYFTSLPNGVSPWDWFKKNVLKPITFPNNYTLINIPETRNKLLNITFANQNKVFNLGFLFSPSPNGNRGGVRSLEFMNFKNAHPQGNYDQFRREHYKQLMFFKHFGYCGNNPVIALQNNF